MIRLQLRTCLLTFTLLGLAATARAETLVGTLPVDVSVDNKGAANATIPLAIPPGRAGLQPKLSLSYSSQGGNGPAGVGFSLSTGFPRAITRGRSLLARDGVVRGINFDANDKYYFDGKRLICVSGTEGQPGSTYRTEVDSFVTITATGSGDNIETFAVADKSGTTMYFGKYNGTSDAYHMLADETTGKALDWAIKRVEDSVGNTVEFRYNESDPEGSGQTFTPGAGEQVLTSIRYTGNPSKGVNPAVLIAFRHNAALNASGFPAGQARPDAGRHYTAGRYSEFTARLDAVLVRSLSGSGAEVDRSYSLKYKPHDGKGLLRLDEVTQQVGEVSTKVVLQWGAAPAAPAAPVAFNHSDIPTFNQLHGDFNGDGKQDILLFDLRPASPTYRQIHIAYSGNMEVLTPVEAPFATSSYSSNILTGDFNGDGRTDIIFVDRYSGAPYPVCLGWYLLLSSGTGFLPAQIISTNYYGSQDKCAGGAAQVGDFNGDGLDDIFINAQGIHYLLTSSLSGGGVSFSEAQVPNPLQWLLTSGNSASYEVTDLDGDGRADLFATLSTPDNSDPAFLYGSCYALRNMGGGSFSRVDLDMAHENSVGSCYVGLAFSGFNKIIGDINGDGLPDLLFLRYTGGYYDAWNNYQPLQGSWQVAISKGNGSYDFSLYQGLPLEMQVGGTTVKTFNQREGYTWVNSIDAGDSQGTINVLEQKYGFEFWGVHLFDYNNDGRKDFVFYTPTKGWLCLLAGPSGFDSANPISLFGGQLTPNIPYESYAADIDGNGQEDFVFVGNENTSTDYSGNLTWVRRSSAIFTSLVSRSDAYRLVAVTNGLNSTASITYKPTTDASVYTPGVPVAYPIQEVRRPQQVVSDIYKDSGASTPAHFSYQYSGNRLDLSGRSSLGFHAFVTLDHQTNLFKYQFLTQSFPMTGLTAREQTYRYWESGGSANFRLLTSHDNTIVFDEVVNGANTSQAWGTVYPYMSKAIESRWEDDPAAHFTLNIGDPSSQPENVFTRLRPPGAHIVITAESWFDNQSFSSGPQTTIPGGYYASDTRTTATAHENVVLGSTDYSSFHNLPFPRQITYGNLRQLKTDFGDGFKETVVTAYKSPVGALTGLVDSTTTSTESPGYGVETAPVKRYTYWGNTPLVATETLDASDDTLDLTTTSNRDDLGRVTSTSVSGYNNPGHPQHIGTYTASSVTAFDSRFDLPTTSLDAYGHPTTTVYHGFFAQPTSITDVNGAQATSTYDSLGRTLQVRDVLKNLQTTTTYAWDTSQYVESPSGVPDGLHRTSVFRTETTATAKPKVTAYCDRLGRPIRAIKDGFAGQQAITDTVFNALGQTVAASLPYKSGTTPLWTKTTYDPLGRVTSTTAPNGTVTTTAYRGRISLVTVDAPDRDPQTNATLVDAKGRTVKVWNADNTPVLDNFATATLAATTTTEASITYDLDGFGRMRSTTLKGQSQPITASYDAHGRQTSLNDPDKGNWTYLNNALGQVVRQTDAKTNVTTSTFDRLGRPLVRTTTEPASGPVETAKWYYYDTAANVATYPHLVAKGDKGWIGSPQREESVVSGAPGYGAPSTATVHYYDDKGRPSLDLTTIDAKWFYSTVTYDAYSRPTETRHYWRPSGYENPTNQPYSWEDYGTIGQYDAASYLLTLTDTRGNTWWQADPADGYDHLDRPVHFRKGSGHWTTRTHRPEDGLLTAISTGNNAVQNLAFGYDGLGNLTARTDALRNLSETYGYDSLNRLTHRSGAQIVSYLANGNIDWKKDVAGAQSATYTYDANKPHAVSTAFGYSMTYDANGNMTQRTGNGHTWTTRWAGFDKPRWLAQDAKGSEFTYNANRSRVLHLEFDQMSAGVPSHYTSKKIYAHGPTVELDYKNFSPTGTDWRMDKVRLYITGPDGTAGTMEYTPGSTTWTGLVYHVDHIGSVESITPYGQTAAGYTPDKAGRDSRYSYDAWGQRRNADTWTGAPANTTRGGDDDLTPRGFTGHEMLDDLGLVHMNGRIYDPLLGRFLSADILVDGPGDLQGYNRYSYVKNRPLSATDPSGFAAKDVVAGVGDSLITNAATAALSASEDANMQAAGSCMLFAAVQNFFGFHQAAERSTQTANAYVSNAQLAREGMQQAPAQAQQTMSKATGSSDTNHPGRVQARGITDKATVAFAVAAPLAVSRVTSQTATKVDTKPTPSVATNTPTTPAPSAVGKVKSDEPATAYRYVGKAEASKIQKDGEVPNTTPEGKPKDVSLTYEKFDTAPEAEAALKIGTQDPRGPQASPTHRVTVDTANAKISYGGNGDTAGAIEIRTPDKLPAISVDELKKK